MEVGNGGRREYGRGGVRIEVEFQGLREQEGLPTKKEEGTKGKWEERQEQGGKSMENKREKGGRSKDERGRKKGSKRGEEKY